ncbi:MAG: hypothetical protein EOR73_09825 [Mesorhizobium sp.]|nr:MAG: hypothetical protein EOR73_09825 [Mesorhizobium sp.]
MLILPSVGLEHFSAKRLRLAFDKMRQQRPGAVWVLKSLLYYFHERAWLKIPYGRRRPSSARRVRPEPG